MGMPERETRDNNESKEAIASMSLKDALVSATFSPNRALDPSVKTINLGTLQSYAVNLMETTLADAPQYREAAIAIYITPRDTMLVQQQPTLGTEQEVQFRGEVKLFSLNPQTPLRSRQDKHVGTVMHTHGKYTFPPSPKDFHDLLLGAEHYQGCAAVMVVTQDKVHVVFRGPSAPTLNVPQADLKVTKWTEMLQRRLVAHVNPFMSLSRQEEINHRAQAAFIRDFTAQHGLLYFSGPFNFDRNADTTLVRQN